MDDRPLAGVGFDAQGVVSKIGLPLTGATITLAQFVPAHTPVPAGLAYEVVTVAMAAVGLLLCAVLSALGAEFSGGRCRAANLTNGERCSKSRPPGEDLCQLHDRHHGVTIHPSVRDESIQPDESTDDVQAPTASDSILNDR